jgi:hypothetical protein
VWGGRRSDRLGVAIVIHAERIGRNRCSARCNTGRLG